jgi:hypothetical protein
MHKKSFRSFLEEEEKQSYLSSLEDILGIDPRDMENEPQIGTFFSFGPEASEKLGITSNVGPYTIKKLKRNKDGQITHAVVVKVNDPRIRKSDYKDEDGKMTRIPSEKENETFLVNIEDLEGLLKQDLEPPPAAGMV